MGTLGRTEIAPGDGGRPMKIYVSPPKVAGVSPVIIVFMEAFGVNEHIKSLCDRFANEGYVAVAPDMYYRQGSDNVFAYNEIPKFMPLMQGMNDVQTNADFRILLNFIRGNLPEADIDKIGCTGYCMGGTLSWLCACLNRDIKAAAVYYSGGLITRETSFQRPVSPHDYAPLLTAPILGLFGETDKNPPPEDVQQVDSTLSELGKPHEFKIYSEAGHGFFCEERPSYNEAAAKDAWDRTLSFFGNHLKK